MLELPASVHALTPCPGDIVLPPSLRRGPVPAIEDLVRGMPLRHRKLRAKQYVFRAGQPRHALYLVHAGMFKTCVASADGRQRITGFQLRGDLLGMDALDLPGHACDAVSLDVGEVWELPYAQLCACVPGFQWQLTALLAGEIRRDWRWMLALGSLSAEQRVIAFLFDLGARFQTLGFSGERLVLRMTRADLGNFLGLQLETVTRAPSHLQARGLIGVPPPAIPLVDREGLRRVLDGAGGGRQLPGSRQSGARPPLPSATPAVGIASLPRAAQRPTAAASCCLR